MAALANSLAALSMTLRAIMRVSNELLDVACPNHGNEGTGGAEGTAGLKHSVSSCGVWYSLLSAVRIVNGVCTDDVPLVVIGLCMADVPGEDGCVADDLDEGTGTGYGNGVGDEGTGT